MTVVMAEACRGVQNRGMDSSAPATTPARIHAVRRLRLRLRKSGIRFVRAIVQTAYAAFLALAGIEFYSFYTQAVSGAPVTAHRPEIVEAFLPISALLALRRLLATGEWDAIHPAGLTILIAALVSSLVARKAFCSWVCPVGSVSRLLAWAGDRLIWRRRRKATLVPGWVDKPLTSLKYLLLGFFAWAVFVAMPLEGVQGFLSSPYNRAADAKMLLFFVDLSGTAGSVLLLLGLVSLVVKNAWCRYLCPYGALLGMVSWLSPLHVVRDKETCTSCEACTKACPVEIPVHRKLRVLTPECTGCMSCVAACPQRGCLTVTRRASTKVSTYVVPAAALLVIFGLWAWGRWSGHWTTSMTQEQLVNAYEGAAELGHP